MPDYERENFLKNRLDALLRLIIGKLYDKNAPGYRRNDTGCGDELIFEYESLYRGILYGATLAMLALSNGSRMSELPQVSWNKERRIVLTEAMVVLGKDGQPLMGDDGKSVTKRVKFHFQHLLPKRAKTEEER